MKEDDARLELERVANFLYSVFGDRISHAEMIALMHILTLFTIELRDGTIINDLAEINKGMWLIDAALVASAMCDEPDREPIWWKSEFPTFDKNNVAYENLVSKLLEEIKASPEVVSVRE